MWIDIQKYYPGSVDIDNYDIRQALMDNLVPIQSDTEIRDNQYLNSEYVNTRLIPALTQLKDETKIAELKLAVETNSDLKDLVEKFTYTPFQQDMVPVEKSDAEIMRSSLWEGWEDVKKFTTETMNLGDENEKENRLNSELIRRANRVMDKFDQYVLRGDRKQHGDDNDWVPWFNDNEQIFETDENNVHEAVEDISLNEIRTAVNDLVTKARNDELTFTLGGYTIGWQNFWGETFGPYTSKAHKMADITARLQIIESWIDTLSPGWAQTTWDIVGKWLAWVGYSIFNLILGFALSAGVVVGAYVGAKGAWKHREPIWNAAKSKFAKPAPGTPPPGGSPATAPTTAPDKPWKYLSLKDSIPKWSVLHNMQPNTQLHELFSDTIRSELTTADQKIAYDKLFKKFNAGKFSREEYFRQIRLIIGNQHGILAKLAKLSPWHVRQVFGVAATGGWIINTAKKATNAAATLTVNTPGFIKNATLKAWEKMLGGWWLYTTSKTVVESWKGNRTADRLSRDFRSYTNLAWKEIALPSQARIDLYKDLEANLYEYDKLREYKKLTQQIDTLNATLAASPSPDATNRVNELMQRRADLNVLSSWAIDVELTTAQTKITTAVWAIDAAMATIPDPTSITGVKPNPHATNFNWGNLFNTALHDVNKTTSILETVLKALAKR